MKKLGLLLVGLLCLSVVVYAGEVITNDTGEDATGLRVSFSQPALITAFGDILTSVDPQMLSFEFVFSGGTVKPWESQWFNYAPTTASVMETEWLTGNSIAQSTAASSIAWQDVPAILTFPEDVNVGYSCGGDSNLANARFWNLDGSRVATVRSDVTDTALLVGIELHDGDVMGDYCYRITFRFHYGARIDARIVPSLEIVEIDYYTYTASGEEHTRIYTATGSEFYGLAGAAYAVIPLEKISEYVSLSVLCNSMVDLHMDYREGSRREVFNFQGQAPTPCSALEVWTPPPAFATKTYEEIMAEIAQYPGPDEPLCVPAEDEEIWLTDLEGHADIYDNDSIKINYADSFDQSQVTEIKVYRNGIKMEFLPGMIDLLTNDQMKTFDGNSMEYSPVSVHTDHAIFGFEFRLNFHMKDGSRVEQTILVDAPFTVSGEYKYADILGSWNLALDPGGMSDSAIKDYIQRIKGLGFNGIYFETTVYAPDDHTAQFFAQYDYDPSVSNAWAKTARDEDILDLLSWINGAGLDAEMAIQLHVAEEYEKTYGGHRSFVKPDSIDEWFSSYTDLIVHYARLAEQGGAEYFRPVVEFNTMQKETEHMNRLLDATGQVFSGGLVVAESTNHYIYDTAPFWFGEFWDHPSVMLGLNCWASTMETQADQRLSYMVERFISDWKPVVEYYRGEFPSTPIIFSEIGCFNTDGSVLGLSTVDAGEVRDDQEMADAWAAYLIATEYLGLDGINVWTMELALPFANQGSSCVNNSAALPIIGSLLGGTPTYYMPVDHPNAYAYEAPSLQSIGVLEYSEAVEVVAYLDWETVSLSETASWGLPGCDVKSVKASISSDELFIELELYTTGLTSGNFEAYALDLHLPSGDHVYILLIPEDRSAILEYYDGTINKYVDTISGAGIALSPHTMSVLIPISEFRSLVSKDELCNATFSFALEAYPGEHHEIFWFPGQTAVDCQQ